MEVPRPLVERKRSSSAIHTGVTYQGHGSSQAVPLPSGPADRRFGPGDDGFGKTKGLAILLLRDTEAHPRVARCSCILSEGTGIIDLGCPRHIGRKQLDKLGDFVRPRRLDAEGDKHSFGGLLGRLLCLEAWYCPEDPRTGSTPGRGEVAPCVGDPLRH